jgi:hypothetical protein
MDDEIQPPCMTEESTDVKKLELSTSPEDKKLLLVRNIMCVIAAALFMFAVFSQYAGDEVHIILRGIAYLFGAISYYFELLVLTDRFTVKPGARVMLMPVLFSALYIFLCISHLIN